MRPVQLTILPSQETWYNEGGNNPEMSDACIFIASVFQLLMGFSTVTTRFNCVDVTNFRFKAQEK
jgi:hypothetical protein